MVDVEIINSTDLISSEILNDLRQIINAARSRVASCAKYEVTMMYWNIGDRINRDVLNYERAEYGKQIVSQLRHNCKRNTVERDLNHGISVE